MAPLPGNHVGLSACALVFAQLILAQDEVVWP